jgi:hypothetical protein
LIFFADNDRKKTINNHQVAPAGGECRLISCGWPSGRAEKESRTTTLASPINRVHDTHAARASESTQDYSGDALFLKIYK